MFSSYIRYTRVDASTIKTTVILRFSLLIKKKKTLILNQVGSLTSPSSLSSIFIKYLNEAHSLFQYTQAGDCSLRIVDSAITILASQNIRFQLKKDWIELI